MSRRGASHASLRFLFLGITLCSVTIGSLTVAVANAQQSGPPTLFFPLTQGTYWVYQGTVTWFDQAKHKASEAKVSLKMTVERVFQREGTLFAEIQGYPADLNFTAGETHPSRRILTESSRHQVFLRQLDPSTSLPLTESPGSAFDSFMTEEDLLFEWPLARGNKYCDPESTKREDQMYCWVVESEGSKNLEAVTSLVSGNARVFTIAYRTNPDETHIELSPGIGIIAYHYRHHVTTAATDGNLTEFHPVPDKSPSIGGTP